MEAFSALPLEGVEVVVLFFVQPDAERATPFTSSALNRSICNSGSAEMSGNHYV